MRKLFGSKTLRLISACGLAVIAITAVTLPGCETTWQTPLGPVTTKPVNPGPGTTIPNPGTPGTQLPNPASPGREVTGYDTDGDGLIDLIWDPVTKQWYKVTPIRVPGTQNPTSTQPHGGANSVGTALQRGGDGQFISPDGVAYKIARPLVDWEHAACNIKEPPLDWGANSAEQWLHNKGLDLPAGQTFTGDLVFKHSFDTEKDADITVYWSSNYGVPQPWNYNLCYAMHGLPSATPGAPAGMQIHVRGHWTDVARWLVDLGIDEIEQTEDGITWNMVVTPDNSAIDVYAGGVFFEQINVR